MYAAVPGSMLPKLRVKSPTSLMTNASWPRSVGAEAIEKGFSYSE